MYIPFSSYANKNLKTLQDEQPRSDNETNKNEYKIKKGKDLAGCEQDKTRTEGIWQESAMGRRSGVEQQDGEPERSGGNVVPVVSGDEMVFRLMIWTHISVLLAVELYRTDQRSGCGKGKIVARVVQYQFAHVEGCAPVVSKVLGLGFFCLAT